MFQSLPGSKIRWSVFARLASEDVPPTNGSGTAGITLAHRPKSEARCSPRLGLNAKELRGGRGRAGPVGRLYAEGGCTRSGREKASPRSRNVAPSRDTDKCGEEMTFEE